MVVLANRHLGPRAELLVSGEAASAMLQAIAAAAAPVAAARWEHELVRWLADRAGADLVALDVAEIAWTPDHFAAQRAFLLAAIAAAAARCPDHATALGRWAQLVEAHPRAAVQVGRRWQWSRIATATI